MLLILGGDPSMAKWETTMLSIQISIRWQGTQENVRWDSNNACKAVVREGWTLSGRRLLGPMAPWEIFPRNDALGLGQLSRRFALRPYSPPGADCEQVCCRFIPMHLESGDGGRRSRTQIGYWQADRKHVNGPRSTVSVLHG